MEQYELLKTILELYPFLLVHLLPIAQALYTKLEDGVNG